MIALHLTEERRDSLRALGPFILRMIERKEPMVLSEVWDLASGTTDLVDDVRILLTEVDRLTGVLERVRAVTTEATGGSQAGVSAKGRAFMRELAERRRAAGQRDATARIHQHEQDALRENAQREDRQRIAILEMEIRTLRERAETCRRGIETMLDYADERVAREDVRPRLARNIRSVLRRAKYADDATRAWQCEACGVRAFARIDERAGDGNFYPGNQVRCVGCKHVSTLEVPR